MLGRNFVGIIWTVCLVCFCWAVALIIKYRKPVSDLRREVARKFVHIGVSNWFFIYSYFFSDWYYPVAGLLFFAIVNYFIEIKTGTRRSWGTVYFPLSIVIMIAMKECGFGSVQSVGCGILGMGYADGFAALVGMKYGKTKMPFSKKKSILGSVVVFLVTIAVVLLFNDVAISGALLIGFAAAFAEAYTPRGLDNFSVPLVIYILSAVLC